MIRTVLVAWLGLLFLTTNLGAQHGMSRIQMDKVPVAALPVQNNDSLLAREIPRRKPGRPQTFAVSLPVTITPERDGKWVSRINHDLWRMRIRSAGAKSLNFGFSRYSLPDGAALYLATEAERFGPFTSADNEDHAQLWTPLLRGDEVVLELEVPPGRKDEVQLVLATVNHDFEGAIDLLSGECHIDVACGAEDGYPQVDARRDLIRSVAAYTLSGTAKCTGFLVNNTNQDGRPLFITANHCGVDERTAPTIVTYWNFENDSCRTPGTAANGGDGNGRLEVYNTGARLLASYASSDMTLIELDEPVNPRARAFFAGWDARSQIPSEEVFTVHHPNLDEKRISFSGQAISRSTIVGETTATGKFLRVPFWDLGSTEGGSSGAPLFDASGLVRGQLFGGRASCGTQEDDMFGWINISWTGGGTPATRLMDWLDPCGTAGRTLPGMDESELQTRVTTSQGCQTVCIGGESTFEFTLGNSFPVETRLIVLANEDLVVDFPESADGGSSFTISVSSDALSAGSYPIRLAAVGGKYRDTVTVTLDVTIESPPAVTAVRPGDKSLDVDPFVELVWQAVDGVASYDLQYSLTSDFTAVVANLTGLQGRMYTPDYPLPGETTYFWRVRANNACGNGAWSDVRSFKTETRTCVLKRGEALPVPIPAANPTEVIAELEITKDVSPEDLEVIVGIEHSFLGDLAVKLVSPSGTSVKLFDPLDEGSCPARNLYAAFSDGASFSAEEFGNRCEDGTDNDYLRVRPLESLSAFSGQSAKGLWKLVVDDQAAMDGGAITEFKLRLCENRADNRQLGVEVATGSIIACSNEGGTATLELGADYTDEISLRIEADGLELDNYTFTQDVINRTVQVIFSAWTFAGAGTQELTFTVLAADGTERQAINTLTVLPLPEPVDPIAARIATDRITFRWRGSAVAESYTLQVAPTENFDAIASTATTLNRQLTLSRADLPEDFYWRVLGNNTCGSFPGPPRAMTADTANATYAVNTEQSIAIYPNPTRGDLHLELKGQWPDQRLQVTLFDASGRLINRWADLRSVHNRLRMEETPPGVYFLRVTGSFGQITERLLLLR